jgi:hypothetical protein
MLAVTPHSSWIQSTDATNLSYTYPLVLNPNGGDVGIGTTAPAARLDVNGNAIITGSFIVSSSVANQGIRLNGPNNRFTIASSTGATNLWNIDNSAGTLRVFRENYAASGPGTAGAVYMAISDLGSSSLGTGTTSATYTLWVNGAIGATGDIVAYEISDIRLKDNLQPIVSPIEKIQSISGYTFVWNDLAPSYFKGQKSIGVVAQEIQKILPEAVNQRDNGYYAVDYDKLIPLLIEAMKEQQIQINELREELKGLKNGS